MSYSGAIPTVQTTVEFPSLNPSDIEESAIRSLVHGDIPTANQVSSALMEARYSLNENKSEMHLSKRGLQLEKDLDQVLGTAAKLIDEKNKEGVLDDLIHNAREVSREVHTESEKLKATVGAVSFPTFFNGTLKYRMLKDGVEAINISKDIILFILGSGEFKQYLIDFLDFLQNFITYTGDEMINLGQSVKSDVKDRSADSTLSEIKDIKDTVLSKGKELTSDTRKEYVERFSSLMKRAAQRPEFNDLINVFWQWMDQMMDRADFMKQRVISKSEEVKDKAQKSSDSITHSDAFYKMWEDSKIIIDDIAGKGAFNSFYSSTWDLFNNLLDDVDARGFFKNLKHFVSDAIKDEKFMDAVEAQDRTQKLLDQAKVILTSSQYKESFLKFFENARLLTWKIANDSSTQEFADSVKMFAQHFTLNRHGKPDIHVIKRSIFQMKNIIYPFLKDKLGTINIKHIVGTDGDYEYYLSDVKLCIPDMLPDTMDIKTKSDTKVSLSKLTSEKNFVKVIMDLNELRPSFKNVSFAYKKNSFPKLEDNGVINVNLSGGKGTRVQVIWKIETSNTPEKPFTISLIRVKCVIDKIDASIVEAKHNILDTLALGLFSNALKAKIAQGLVEGIAGFLKPLNDQLNTFFATRPLEHFYDEANDQIMQSYGRYMDRFMANPHPMRSYEEKARDLVNSVTSKAEGLRESLTVKGHDIADRINENLDLSKEIASDAKGLYSKATTKEVKSDYTFYADDDKAEEVKKYEADSAQKTEELKQKAIELKDATLETAGKLKDKTVDGATELKEFTTEKANEAIDYAKEKYPEVKEKAIEIKDQAVEKATELKDKAVEKGNQAAEKANELKDKALEKGAELKEKAEEKLGEAKEYADKKIPEVKEKANELKDKAVEKGSELKDKASKKVDEASEKASELKDKAVEKGSELKDKAVEKGSELKDKTSKKVDEVSKKASDLKDQAAEKGSELKDKASKKVDEASEKASELKDKASEKADEAAKKAKQSKDDIVEKASELGDEIKEKYPESKKKFEELLSDLQDKAQDAKEEAKKDVQDSKSSTTGKASDSALYFGKVAVPPELDQTEEDKMGSKSYAEVAKDLKDISAEPTAPGKVSWDSEWAEGTTAI